MKIHIGYAALLLAALPVAAASGFELITRADVRAAAQRGPAADGEIVKRGIDVNAPLIRLKQPDVTKPIRSPVNIEMAFEARPDAQIVPDSFRARYLFLDLTERIRKHATIDRDGVRVHGAELPTGSFRIVFEIADTLRRTGKLEVTVNVE